MYRMPFSSDTVSAVSTAHYHLELLTHLLGEYAEENCICQPLGVVTNTLPIKKKSVKYIIFL